MRSLTIPCIFGVLTLAVSCAIPVGVHSERLTVEDSAVFHFSEIGPRHSMSILNQGPGPIEVLLGEEDEHTHPIEIPEGTFEYVRTGELKSLEIRHPASGAGEIEWTVLEDLRDRVRVEVH